MSFREVYSKEENKKTAVEELKQGLYKQGASGVKIKPRTVLRNKEDPVINNQGWDNVQDMPKQTRKKSARFTWAQKFFLASFLFFAVAGGFTFFTFYQNKNTVSGNNIHIDFSHPTFIDGGEEMVVGVTVTNKNHAPLAEVKVFLEYPSVTAGNDSGIARMSKEIGLIGPGESKVSEFPLILYGEQGSQKNLEASLQYQVQGSNAVFEKKDTSFITLRSTPVDILFSVPSEVVSNQLSEYEFRVISQSTEVLRNIYLQVEFPAGFQVEESKPISLVGDDLWALGTLDPLEEKVVTVSGYFTDQPGQEKVVRAYVGAGDTAGFSNSIKTVYNSFSQSVSLVEPFLLADIYVERSTEPEVFLSAGSQVVGTVYWVNNTTEAIKNPEIYLYISGSSYNKSAVEPVSGFFDSADSKIIWSKSTIDSLAVIEPNESGTVRFSLTPRSLSSFSVGRPEIVLRTGVKGVTSGGQIKEAVQIDTMRIRFGTSLSVLSEALYYTGPFTNTGPMPPRAEKETTYTIRWTLTNTVNPVNRLVATATLPPYVSWVGNISPQIEDVVYNSSDRTVTWKINEFNPTGTGGSGRVLYFQVKLRPSSSQLGESVQLLSPVSVQAIDSSTRSNVSANSRNTTNRLLNDGPNRPGADGSIVE